LFLANVRKTGFGYVAERASLRLCVIVRWVIVSSDPNLDPQSSTPIFWVDRLHATLHTLHVVDADALGLRRNSGGGVLDEDISI
jgi:hypothetical protein